MIKRFMLLLLLLLLLLVPFTSLAEATFWRNRDWSRTFRVFRSIQASLLDSRLTRASIHNDIVFHCMTAVTSTSTNATIYSSTTSDGIFTVHLNDMDGFRRLNVNHRLGFFLHGWEFRSRSNIWMLDILKTWASFEDINVCIVDWGSLSQRSYANAVLHIFDVGFTLASVIESLEMSRLFHRSNITLTGYSLGAHAAGFTGQLLGGEVDHIIGLDPAGPMFTVPADVGPKYRLDPSDGKFVQVIHTSGGILGVMVKSGHADFYPNGGVSPQTNCALPFRESTPSRVVCSHAAAVKYFTFSMEKAYPYVGYRCANYVMFIFGTCYQNARGHFGIHTNRVEGSFYLLTNRAAPYVPVQAAKQV